MNSTALIHASSAVLICLFGNHNLVRMNTGGYFLFDMLYLLRNRKMNLLHGLYMYHHMAVMYYMSLNHREYNWVNNVAIAELSNIPTYFVYYYLKKNMKNELSYWKPIQKYWYGFFRMPLATMMTYYEINNKKRFITLLPMIPVYFMGLIWAGVIIKN